MPKYAVTFRAVCTFQVVVEASDAGMAEDLAFHCCDTEHLQSHEIEETTDVRELPTASEET